MDCFDINMEFSPSLFLASSPQNSFYDDPLPTEEIEATGFFQIPVLPDSE